MKAQQYCVEESEEQQYHKKMLREKPLECMLGRKVSKNRISKWKSNSI